MMKSFYYQSLLRKTVFEDVLSGSYTPLHFATLLGIINLTGGTYSRTFATSARQTHDTNKISLPLVKQGKFTAARKVSRVLGKLEFVYFMSIHYFGCF